MTRHLFRSGIFCSALLLSIPLYAQLITDEVPRARTVPQREQVETQIEESRYRFGIFNLDPLFELRDLGFNNNVLGVGDGEVGDWTATVGAGLRGITPVGQKIFLRFNALPSYFWYDEFEERRHFGGRYGGDILMLFNRLSIEAGAARKDDVAAISSEIERPIRQIEDRRYARAEVELLRRLSVFGRAETLSPKFDSANDDDLLVELLDRDDSVVAGGIRYRFRSYFDVSVAAEETTSEFERDPTRDFDTRGMMIGVHYDRPRTFINLSAGQRTAEVPGRGIEAEETTGSYYLARRVGSRSELQFFGRRHLVPALYLENPFFLESRNGVALELKTGSRASIRFSAENGENDYPQPVQIGSEAVQRFDDVVAYAARLQVRLFSRVTFQLNASQTEYDSNIVGADRSVLRYTTGISFLGDNR